MQQSECINCGETYTRYSTIGRLCGSCTRLKQASKPRKPRTPLPRAQKPLKRSTKPIAQRGKHAKQWATFRDKIAKPYLDKKYGRVCSVVGCEETENLDVDHIFSLGAHPELRYVVTNLRYLCRPHHRARTDVAGWSGRVSFKSANRSS